MVKVNDKYYDAVITQDKYIYEVELPDCTRKGVYAVEISKGSDVLSSNNRFEIKKKGFTENTGLFD
jgi:hypothetical protein